ncbi:MAG: alanine racemase [Actinomycetia bacterium]|nr:alanine racemase [Actinomycetes bacterium]
MNKRYPLLSINLKKIRKNTEFITSICNKADIKVVGITKGVLGDEKIAENMLSAGADLVGDSRIKNLINLSGKVIDKNRLMMIRQPMRDETKEAVELSEYGLITTFESALWLSEAAKKRGNSYKLIIMIELGDKREGVNPEETVELLGKISKLKNVSIEGIGTNLFCLQKEVDQERALMSLVELADKIRNKTGIAIQVISGGNSSIWSLLRKNKVPGEINQVRIGEAILLGKETMKHEPVSELFQDAIVLTAEILETGEKRYNHRMKKQAVLALGRQDIADGKLNFQEKGAREIRRSSDHLMVDITEHQRKFKPGDLMEIIPDYFSLLALMVSPFIGKEYH